MEKQEESRECDKGFSCSFMLLKPEEVKFIDLFRILFSSNLEDRKFVDSSSETEESFRYRWLIFISILAQKMLMLTSKPMAWMGSKIEMLLNLLAINNFLVLLRGKTKKPDKDSAIFISFIGNMDKRMKLDSKIKPEHGCHYYSALSMMASKASYENRAYIETIVKDHWKMEYLGFYDHWNDYQEKATTQLFFMRDKSENHDTIVVAFRGTEPFDADAWCSDFDLSWYELQGMGKIHGGFMKALGLQKNVGWPMEYKANETRGEPLAYYFVRDKLKALLSESENTKYILTGHSLGGALAILFPAILFLHEEKLLLQRLEGVYTYGQPRVGDEKFGKYMESKLEEHKIRYFRIVYCNDMVPRLPYDDKDLMFKHFGTCVYYNRHYQGKVVAEIPNKNYFSPLSAIPMMINAICELIRSFTICYSKGAEYKEDHYLMLKPNEVSIRKVIRLLWSKRMEENDYFYLRESDEKEVFIEKGLAIASLAAQKGLLHAAKLLKCFGQKLEMWLNLVSFNTNIFMLFFNTLRCKVKIPKRESDDFMSFAAHIDKRVKLDEKIEPGNARYNSALAIMAAKLAYENKGFIRNTVEQHWKMEFIDMDTNYWNDYLENFHTQGFMFYDERMNMIVVSFRGTEAFNAYDWCTDFDISCFENPEMGKIHGGFMKALGLVMDHGWPPQLPADKRNKNLAYYAIRDELNERMDLNKETKFIVTGHSLGGALAVLFPAILALHGETKLLERLEGIYTFGQPRVGDGKFKRFMEEQVLDRYGVKYLRFVYCNDLITRLPFDDPVTSLYTHFGTCLYFNSCYKGQILDEEPHKNYFATFGGTRRFLNALFELVRCLYLPLLKGGDYREGLAMILIVRFTALAFPAVADHNPLDYVNATRLGSMEVFQRAESSKKWLKNSATSGREVQDKIKYC